ncbi:MAG: MFS transporter [Verrucomicrobiota bacterium]
MDLYPANVRLFVAFRVLFNARFYYPVFAVMFLDFGLTMEELAILNAIWAIAIVSLEVPSGALADRIGRKPMVALAAVLMVIEMALIAFVPLGNHALVFWVFVLNRVISGAAEACASGADEALAYDSLVASGQASEWPRVLESMLRWQSAGFFIAMPVGAALYDPDFVNPVAQWLGASVQFARSDTLRFPIYVTLGVALGTCVAAFRMKEPPLVSRPQAETHGTLGLILGAGRWILATPAVLVLILAGLLHDSFIRLQLTLGSEFYRLIQLPEASYGLIGAAMSALGFFLPAWARRLCEHRTAAFNFAVVAAMTFVGLVGIGLAWPFWGLAFAVILRVAIGLVGFFLSHYINEMADSSHRATVLSFRGLALNLGYGGLGLAYAALHQSVRTQSPPGTEASVMFAETLRWLPWCFLVGLAALVVFARRKLR